MQNIAEMSDGFLCQLVAQGNREAEELLVVRYNRLVRICTRPFFLVGAGLGSMVGISGIAEIVLGVLICVFPSSIGLFLGLFAIVHAIDTIVFSLSIGRDRTNTLW